MKHVLGKDGIRTKKLLIDKRILLKIRAFFFIYLVLLVMVIIDTVRFSVNFFTPILGILCGIAVGILFSRMSKLSWNESENKVISKMDYMGIALLILYLVFTVNRTWILEHFVHGRTLTVASLSVIAGTMFGRLLGTRMRLLRIISRAQPNH